MPSSPSNIRDIYGFPTSSSAYDFMNRFVVCNSCMFAEWANLNEIYPDDDKHALINGCSGEYWVVEDDEVEGPEGRVHFVDYYLKYIKGKK